ncbi:MAG: aminopeptidase, partial [Clostridiaceae bacterium]|nr:aminopeptidase [Clostridiaceae bacterium]
MNNELLEKYALLLVKTGINIQKNQTLVINAPIECASFVRIASRIAYIEGARDVVINWRDELSSKIKFMNAPEDVFEEYPDWQRDFYLSNVHKGAAFLSISASDPELMMDVDPQRMAKSHKAASNAIKEYRERLMSNRNVWCIASIPTISW